MKFPDELLPFEIAGIGRGLAGGWYGFAKRPREDKNTDSWHCTMDNLPMVFDRAKCPWLPQYTGPWEPIWLPHPGRTSL